MRQSVALAVLATLLVSACADMLVGGKSESSQVDDAVRKAADVAVHKLNSDSNLLTASLGASAATPLRVAAIKDVKTQVRRTAVAQNTARTSVRDAAASAGGQVRDRCRVRGFCRRWWQASTTSSPCSSQMPRATMWMSP